MSTRAWVLAACLVSPAAAQLTTRLAPETLQQFDTYVKKTESEMSQRWTGRKPFLWLDENLESRQNARNGEVVVKSFGGQNGVSISGGLVHDWLGATFIPGARLEQVEAVIQNFDGHKKYYPEVIDSKTLRRDGNTVYGYWRLRKKKVLTVELSTELEVHADSLDPSHWYTRSYTKRMNEIADPGTPKEKDMPDGEGHGFLWRLNAYWRLQQEKDGVYAECHTLSLSRDVPSALGWIVRPIIRDLPRESLIQTLKATARAVREN